MTKPVHCFHRFDTKKDLDIRRQSRVVQDVLVAAEPSAARFQARELETTLAVESEHLVRCGDLKGVAADPIHKVVLAIHPSPALRRGTMFDAAKCNVE